MSHVLVKARPLTAYPKAETTRRDTELLDVLADYLARHGAVTLDAARWEEGVTVQIAGIEHGSDEPMGTTHEALRSALASMLATPDACRDAKEGDAP